MEKITADEAARLVQDGDAILISGSGGGHSVPEADIRRRFSRSLWNLMHIYRGMVDEFMIFDNSGSTPHPVVHASEGRVKAWDLERWDQIQAYGEKHREG